MEEYNIYAVRAERYEESLEFSMWLQQCFAAGEARFGEGSIEEKDRPEYNPRNRYLLKIKPGDYLAYLNQFQAGEVTVAKVTGVYAFTREDKSYKGDFRHCISIDPRVVSFFRHDAYVQEDLSHKLGLQGRWYRIQAKNAFEQVLKAHKAGKLGKKAEETGRLKQLLYDSDELLKQMAEELERNDVKDFEATLIQCLEKMLPNAQLDASINSEGLNAVLSYDDGIPIEGMSKAKRCAVQIMADTGTVSDIKIFQEIKMVFARGKEEGNEFDSCLLLTTGYPTQQFLGKLNKLREESGKSIGLIAGKSLASIVMRYHPDLFGMRD